MGEYEDYVREAIKKKYGSIPKMSEATGIAATTIYHALERGMRNTRTETSSKIEGALQDLLPFFIEKRMNEISAQIDQDGKEAFFVAMGSEFMLIDLYRSMTKEGQKRLLEQAEMLASKYAKNQVDSLGA